MWCLAIYEGVLTTTTAVANVCSQFTIHFLPSFLPRIAWHRPSSNVVLVLVLPRLGKLKLKLKYVVHSRRNTWRETLFRPLSQSVNFCPSLPTHQSIERRATVTGEWKSEKQNTVIPHCVIHLYVPRRTVAINPIAYWFHVNIVCRACLLFLFVHVQEQKTNNLAIDGDG